MLRAKFIHLQRCQKLYHSSTNVNTGQASRHNHDDAKPCCVSWRHSNALSSLKHSINPQHPPLSYVSNPLSFLSFTVNMFLSILFNAPWINKHFAYRLLVLHSSLVTPCAAHVFSLHQNITSLFITPFMSQVRCVWLEKQSPEIESYCTAVWCGDIVSTHIFKYS